MLKELASLCLNCQNPFCVKGCPAHNNIPKIISLIKENKESEAYAENLKTSVLPGVCSSLCEKAYQCEGSCIKGKSSKFNYQPVAISKIEKALSQKFQNKIAMLDSSLSHLNIAIIGAGISGLSASLNLARRGAHVEIFEKAETIGGVVKEQIPAFRFDDTIFEEIMKNLESLKVQIHYHYELGVSLKIRDLKRFDYVLFAMGTMRPNVIFNDEHPAFLQASEVLSTLKKQEFGLKVEKALVIGAGNVAMDASRALQRINIKTTIVYRRTMEFSPSSKQEIEEALADGVTFYELASPKALVIKDNVLEGLEVDLMKKSDKLDKSGRPIFEKTGQTEFIKADLVVMATGSTPDIAYLQSQLPELFIGNDKENNYQNYEKYYLIGDIALGASTVVKAMKSALDATNEIIKREGKIV